MLFSHLPASNSRTISERLREDRLKRKRYPRDGKIVLPRVACKKLNPKLQYAKVTNCVITVKFGVAANLRRLCRTHDVGKPQKFPAGIFRTDNDTSLVFETGAAVTPGCSTKKGALLQTHKCRMRLEKTEQPFVIEDAETGEKRLRVGTLEGLTEFEGFDVVNVVSNRRLSDGSVVLGELEEKIPHVDWNPVYFPGMGERVTNDDVNGELKKSQQISVTVFDTSKIVIMGAGCPGDCHRVFRKVYEQVKPYLSDAQMPFGGTVRYARRQQQKSSSQARKRARALTECETREKHKKRKIERVISRDAGGHMPPEHKQLLANAVLSEGNAEEGGNRLLLENFQRFLLNECVGI